MAKSCATLVFLPSPNPIYNLTGEQTRSSQNGSKACLSSQHSRKVPQTSFYNHGRRIDPFAKSRGIFVFLPSSQSYVRSHTLTNTLLTECTTSNHTQATNRNSGKERTKPTYSIRIELVLQLLLLLLGPPIDGLAPGGVRPVLVPEPPADLLHHLPEQLRVLPLLNLVVRHPQRLQLHRLVVAAVGNEQEPRDLGAVPVEARVGLDVELLAADDGLAPGGGRLLPAVLVDLVLRLHRRRLGAAGTRMRERETERERKGDVRESEGEVGLRFGGGFSVLLFCVRFELRRKEE